MLQELVASRERLVETGLMEPTVIQDQPEKLDLPDLL